MYSESGSRLLACPRCNVNVLVDRPGRTSCPVCFLEWEGWKSWQQQALEDELNEVEAALRLKLDVAARVLTFWEHMVSDRIPNGEHGWQVVQVLPSGDILAKREVRRPLWLDEP